MPVPRVGVRKGVEGFHRKWVEGGFPLKPHTGEGVQDGAPEDVPPTRPSDQSHPGTRDRVRVGGCGPETARGDRGRV